MSFTAKAQLVGVIGHPVGHSLSPMLHNRWIAETGLDAVYVPLAVRPGDLPKALTGLRALGFVGANVTIPHKEEALRLADTLDAGAAALGAVNTLHFAADGLKGYNTDAAGFMGNLKSSVPGWMDAVGQKPVLVLGAGGAARAVVFGLIEAGCRHILIANRTIKRASEVASVFASRARVEAIAWHVRHEAGAACRLVVNTTSLGMAGSPPLDFAFDALSPETIAADIVYTPLETAFLRDARARGLRTVEGLGMLVEQARAAFEIWFGVLPAYTDDQHNELLAALAARAKKA